MVDPVNLADLRASATREYRGDARWFDLDDKLMSITLEDGEFLYALVRVTKPLNVVETGTGNGISTVFIATALRDNNQGGEVQTYEPYRQYSDPAKALVGDELPVVFRDGHCPGWNEGDATDLCFLDSAPWDDRCAEIQHWLTCGYQGLVVVHDAERRPAELNLGVGVLLPGADGLWVGRGR